MFLTLLNDDGLRAAGRPIRDDDSARGVINLDTPPGPTGPPSRSGTGSTSRLTRPARVASPSCPTGVTRSSASSPTSSRPCPSYCDDVCFLVLIDRDAVQTREGLLTDFRLAVADRQRDMLLALFDDDGLRAAGRSVRNLDAARSSLDRDAPSRPARVPCPAGIARSSSACMFAREADCHHMSGLILVNGDAVTASKRLLFDGHGRLVANVKGNAVVVLLNRDGLCPTGRAVRNLDSARD